MIFGIKPAKPKFQREEREEVNSFQEPAKEVQDGAYGNEEREKTNKELYDEQERKNAFLNEETK